MNFDDLECIKRGHFARNKLLGQIKAWVNQFMLHGKIIRGNIDIICRNTYAV